MLNKIIDKIRGIGSEKGSGLELGRKPEKKEYGRNVTKSVPKSNPRNIYSLFTSEFAELDLQRVKQYIETGRKGLNFYKSLFFEYIRREDLRIGGVCQTRKLSLVGRLRGVLSGGGLESLLQGGDKISRDYLVECYASLSFANIITDIVEAQLQGLSIFEIDYEFRAGKIFPSDIKIIPNHLVLYDDVNDEYKIMDITKNDAFLLRTLSNNYSDRIDIGSVKLLEVDPRKILEVHSFDGNQQNGFMNGCIDSLIIAYYFKRYGISDWATFLELYATPARVGKYDPLASTPADIKSLETGVKNFGSNSWAVISKNTDLEFPGAQGKKESSDIYKDYVNFFDEAIAIRVLGQTLTTSVGEKGSYAAANVHNTVRDDILNSDMMLVENTLDKLNRRLLDMNFSNVEEYPVVRFPDIRGIEDKKTLSEILQNLRSAGYEPDIDMLIDEFGFNLTVKAEPPFGTPIGTPKEQPGKGNITQDSDIDELIRELI